jgi:hypothetical protein
MCQDGEEPDIEAAAFDTDYVQLLHCMDLMNTTN